MYVNSIVFNSYIERDEGESTRKSQEGVTSLRTIEISYRGVSRKKCYEVRSETLAVSRAEEVKRSEASRLASDLIVREDYPRGSRKLR